MTAQPPSGAVKVGNALVTLLFALALLFGVVTLVSVAVGLARHGNSLLYGSSLSVPLELSPDQVHPLPAGVELTEWPKVTVQLSDPTTKQMLLRSAMDFGPVLVSIAGLWLLRNFMRSVIHGDPFGDSNVQRLRRLGLLLVLGVPAVELVNYSLRLAFFNDLPAHPFGDLASQGFSLPGAALLGGLAAYILAEVFAYGSRLREDVEATV